MSQNGAKNDFKNLAKSIKNLLVPKTSQIDARLGPEAPALSQNGFQKFKNRGQDAPRGAKMEPAWAQDGAKTAKKSENNKEPAKKRGAPHRVAAFYLNMCSVWPQLGSHNGARNEKSDAKIDQNFCASRGRFSDRFCWILGGNMGAGWR